MIDYFNPPEKVKRRAKDRRTHVGEEKQALNPRELVAMCGVCGGDEPYESQNTEQMDNLSLRQCQECGSAKIRLGLVAEREQRASHRCIRTSLGGVMS